METGNKRQRTSPESVSVHKDSSPSTAAPVAKIFRSVETVVNFSTNEGCFNNSAYSSPAAVMNQNPQLGGSFPSGFAPSGAQPPIPGFPFSNIVSPDSFATLSDKQQLQQLYQIQFQQTQILGQLMVAVQELVHSIASLRAPGPPDHSAIVKDVVDELEDRSLRREKRNNLVMINFPEVASEAESQPKSDINVVKDIFEAAGFEEPAIVKVERLGAPNPKNLRPLKIFTASFDQKMTVLTKQRDALLKVPAIAARGRKVFLRHDLTPKQLELDRNLRDELRSTRERDPSKSYKIRGGRVVLVSAARVQGEG